MKKHILCMATLLAAVMSVSAAPTKIVAHRGYWTAPGSAQNSIRSLVKADSVGADASEFDVYIIRRCAGAQPRRTYQRPLGNKHSFVDHLRADSRKR